jgi:hypothetical protein
LTPVEEKRAAQRASQVDVQSVSKPPPDEDAPQIDILFQLLRAEPCVLSA